MCNSVCKVLRPRLLLVMEPLSLCLTYLYADRTYLYADRYLVVLIDLEETDQSRGVWRLVRSALFTVLNTNLHYRSPAASIIAPNMDFRLTRANVHNLRQWF